MRLGSILLVGSLSVSIVSTAHSQRSVSFEAIIHAGENYTYPIGHGLFFSLKQDDGRSWNFQVKPSQSSSESYTDCLVSPVMHGPGTTDLLAWRFAPDADADVDWAEHIPVQKRFTFVTTAADQKYECAEQNAVYDSFQRSQSRGSEEDYSGLPHYRHRPQAKGEAVVQSVTLKSGLSGKNAEFEHITIHVSIQFPIRTKPTRAKPRSMPTRRRIKRSIRPIRLQRFTSLWSK